MTIYRGLLLFDMSEKPITCPAGVWENQLGYRGLKEVWKLSGTGKEIHVSPYDDGEPESEDGDWEVTLENGDECAFLAFGSFEECDRQAKEFMAKYGERQG